MSSRLTASFVVLLGLGAPLAGVGALVDNLQGYWTFESDYTDQSGHNRTATPGGAGAATILSGSTFGRVGDSAQFNGTNQYVFLPITYGVVPGQVTPTVLGQNFTISAWYYLTGTTTGTTRYFVYESDAAGNTPNRYSLSFEIRSDIALGDFAGSVTAGRNPSPAADNLSRFAGAAPTDVNGQPTWVHLLETYSDNGNGTTTITTYFNGVALNTQGAPVASNAPQTQQTSIIYEASGINLGTFRDANARWWNGYIDEVAVWDRALSSSEIGEVYNAGLSNQAIPEPSVGVLSIFAMLAFVSRRRQGPNAGVGR